MNASHQLPFFCNVSFPRLAPDFITLSTLSFIFCRCHRLSVSLCIVQLFTRSPPHAQPLVDRQQRLRVKWLALITAELMTDISTELLSNWIQRHWKACFFFSFSAEQHVTSNLFAIVMQTLFTWFPINSHLHYKKVMSTKAFVIEVSIAG